VREDLAFEELLASIKAQGIIQPLLIDETNKILAGHRRYFAAQIVGLDRVPIHVLKHHKAPHLIPLIENLQRLDLGVLEAADYFLKCQQEHEMSIVAISEATGISTSTIGNYIKLATGPKEVRDRIERDEIPLNAAFELLRHDSEFIKEIIKTPRLTKEIVREKAQARCVDQPRPAPLPILARTGCPAEQRPHLEYAISAVRELLAASPNDDFATRYKRWIRVMEDDLADLEAKQDRPQTFRGVVAAFQRQAKPLTNRPEP
jgi:ParB/RepB/Spo0J family partition protein